tara:strand:- start:460 stop:831 length:372 start_codon:yes stop_codon:yes gene_type:complete
MVHPIYLGDVKMAKAAPNYTDEQVQQAVTEYAVGGNGSLDTIAANLGKTRRSVIAKLVREGVYIAEVKGALKEGQAVKEPTKKEIFMQLEQAVPSEVVVTGLFAATKESLVSLLDYFSGKTAD